MKEPGAGSPSATAASGDGTAAGLARKAEAVVQVLREDTQVSKRRSKAGSVRVSTHTEMHEEVVETTLQHRLVDVTRVPVGRIVDEVPETRTEGDTTIIPVVEEHLVVVKQLFLKEELHVRQIVEHEIVQTPVSLRRQTAVVERFDSNGAPAPGTQIATIGQ